MSARRATHAGSWYTDSPRELNGQLNDWLSLVDSTHSPARAIIAPHAGYTYCGSCGAYAYRQVNPAMVKHIFILGPSHNVRLSGCALSSTSKYRTPLYDLTIDQSIYEELYSTGCFERMSLQTDEDEHSIEMHLPYIAKVMEEYRGQFTIVPVLVGSLSTEKESQYGKLFARYLMDPKCLFVISSDFCHWGQRFRYTYYDKSYGNIYQSVEKLDRMGMDIIEHLSPQNFTEYLKKFGNTICGRHPIGVLLHAVQAIQKADNNYKVSFKFLKYAQSSRCINMHDSSVSYAAGTLVIE